MNPLALQIIQISHDFEDNYKEALNQADIDLETIDVLYNLGADIVHKLDEAVEIIKKN
jgi:hypothetical protein|nr:MAG TPA: hypothetical protein [Caudoviricetes sp.]